MKFYVGLHHPGDAKRVDRACISIHAIERRRKPILCDDVLVDSGAFTKLAKHGGYPESVEAYADQLYRLWTDGVVRITTAVAQDYMCEPFMVEKTGLSVYIHQRLTVMRYDALRQALIERFGGPPPFHLMPVLQGWTREDYVRHIRMYGDRLKPGMLVGVGSVCKRQGSVSVIEDILKGVHEERPDILLHGFGVKLTALRSPLVRELLHTADSMAWSYSARKQGRDANSVEEAILFAQKVDALSA